MTSHREGASPAALALVVAVSAAALLLAGCAAPDYRRGKAALEAGDIDAAEKDLQPLAGMGYDDAKLQLARVYARRTDPESLQKAIALYRELLDKDPAVAIPLARAMLSEGNETAIAQAEEMLIAADRQGNPLAPVLLLELYSDHPERDRGAQAARLAPRVAKMGTPEAEVAVIKWYRRNALSDPKFAKALVDLCEPAKDRLPDCYVDLARYYRAAGADKKLKALHEAALKAQAGGLFTPAIEEKYGWSLASEDLQGAPWPEAAYPMLKDASETSTTATIRMARLLIEYPHLDSAARPEQLLLKAGEQGQPEALLALGRLYLDGKLVPGDPERAEKYLRQASATLPQAHYHLGRLYGKGMLGKADPVRAAQHFLTAARGGYFKADQALAQLFSDNRGVKPNYANAYVFATLASQEQVPEGDELLKQVRASLPASQVDDARRLLKQEVAVRQGTPRTVDPDAADAAAFEAPPRPLRSEGTP